MLQQLVDASASTKGMFEPAQCAHREMSYVRRLMHIDTWFKPEHNPPSLAAP